MKHRIHDFDFVFLSYDEPNAEQLYAELLDLVPWSKRVHGIKGFDLAHKKCAEVADTDFFVTVDGDNRIYPEFMDLEIEIREDQAGHAWTWSGRNHVNGLVYGNGGLKLWSKAFVNRMQSHESSSDDRHKVDFCWNANYHDLMGCYSTSIVNSTPKQAWRSGFREGVKMCLDRGQRVRPDEFRSRIWYGNITRLCVWSSVGQDVENGIWSIYGARMGCHMATMTSSDHSIISDYDEFDRLWDSVKDKDPARGSIMLGEKIKSSLGISISLLSPEDSAFFKGVYMNPPRPYMPWETIGHFMATKHV